MEKSSSVRIPSSLRQPVLTDYSQFIVSSQDARTLGRKSSVSRVASRMSFNQASKTSTTLEEMSSVSISCIICVSLSSIATDHYRIRGRD